MSRAWYAFTGSGSGTLNTADYLYTSLSPNCNEGTEVICSVYGTFVGGSTHPLGPFSSNLQTYIGNAISSQLAQPLGVTKKYVYTRIPS